jgi:hypothetical protein
MDDERIWFIELEEHGLIIATSKYFQHAFSAFGRRQARNSGLQQQPPRAAADELQRPGDCCTVRPNTGDSEVM